MANDSSKLAFDDPALPPGSLILVTGANGFIGSWTVEFALRTGYRVRGSVRKAENDVHLIDGWKQIGHYETIVIPDQFESGAWTEAVKGVDGVIHISGPAGNVWQDPDAVKQSTKELLDECEKAGVKRFVFTSSSWAAGSQAGGVKHWDEHTHIDVTQAKKMQEQMKGTPMVNVLNYGMYKSACEQMVLAYGQRPNSTLRTASVAFNNTFGPVLRPGRSTIESPSLRIALLAFSGEYAFFKTWLPQWASDVRNVALAHLGALLSQDPSIVGHRIWMVNEKYNLFRMLDVYRQLYPSRTWPQPDFEDPGNTKTEIDGSGGRAALAAFGQKPYTLQEMLEASVGSEAHPKFKFDPDGRVILPENLTTSMPNPQAKK